MAQIKTTLKKIGRYAWEMFKDALPALFMYLCAGTILMLLTLKEDLTWDNTKLLWTIVCIVAAAAYNALIAWACGGSQFEMLVSGNIKRVTAEKYGSGYKISTHKEAKEYREWKGFVIGAYMAIFTIIFGILFGCNQAKIDGGLNGGAISVIVLLGFLLSGWSLLPLYFANASGVAVSYFLSLLFALIPIVVTGVLYIVGAYARRAKTIRQQELADKAAAAEQTKEKKINYGGLPGTKPKKRK